MAWDPRPKVELVPNVNMMINIGAGLDIPTGMYLRGKYGESILNGGLGIQTGLCGIGNNFKSTEEWYMMLSAMDKIFLAGETSSMTYDTEMNIHPARLFKLTQRFNSFKKRNILDDNLWAISNKANYFANEWYEKLRDFLKEKIEHEKEILYDSPFLDRDGKTLMKVMLPSFAAVDSFSEFETEDVAKIQEENELGDSGGNMIHARQGLAKARFLMDIPARATRAYCYLFLVAQMGKEMLMASGPVPTPPPKKLQFLKNGDKLKGTTDKFTYNMSNLWHCVNAAPYTNKLTKGPEYPLDPSDNAMENRDLFKVTLRQLRSKSGMTGVTIDHIVSQQEGVLPELTEFELIKSDNRYGLSGNLQHYYLDLLPDVKLSRTTIRSKLDNDPKLCRALNITSEMSQIKTFMRSMDALMCSPKELYEDLIKRGYDWEILLNTRGWYTLNNDRKDLIPFLSTKDLLEMRLGLYHPYWYPVKKEDLKPGTVPVKKD